MLVALFSLSGVDADYRPYLMAEKGKAGGRLATA
jgi:hypothetical protein